MKRKMFLLGGVINALKKLHPAQNKRNREQEITNSMC